MPGSAPFVDWVDIIPDDWKARTTPLSGLRGDQIFCIAHHSYSRTIGSILATFKSKDRTVTANLAIGPEVAGVDDYKCVETVPIDRGRAYTTSSSYDNVALTFEMANLSLDPPYPVGRSGKVIAAYVVAWLHVTYGMPIDRHHVTCHREVYERGWGSYPTTCPGDDLHDALDWICAAAIQIVESGGLPGPEEPTREEDMPVIIRNDSPQSSVNPHGGEIGVINGAHYAPLTSFDEVNAMLLITGPAPHGGNWTGFSQGMWEAIIKRLTGRSRDEWDNPAEVPVTLTDEQIEQLAAAVVIPTNITLTGELS